MKEKLLYTIGELLAMEAEEVENVSYKRGEENCLYVLTKDGKKFKLIVEES